MVHIVLIVESARPAHVQTSYLGSSLRPKVYTIGGESLTCGANLINRSMSCGNSSESAHLRWPRWKILHSSIWNLLHHASTTLHDTIVHCRSSPDTATSFAQPTGLPWSVREATARDCRAHGPTRLAGCPSVPWSVLQHAAQILLIISSRQEQISQHAVWRTTCSPKSEPGSHT